MISKTQLEKVQVCLYENVPEKCDGRTDCGDPSCTVRIIVTLRSSLEDEKIV